MFKHNYHIFSNLNKASAVLIAGMAKLIFDCWYEVYFGAN